MSSGSPDGIRSRHRETQTPERPHRSSSASGPSATVAAESGSQVVHAEDAIPLDPRVVWVRQVEPLAEDMMDGKLQLAKAAEMIAGLLETAAAGELEWHEEDGVLSSTLLRSEGYGELSVSIPLESGDRDGEFNFEFGFFDPPGQWKPGEASDSSLMFNFKLDESGSVDSFSAALQSTLKWASDGGPADNEVPLPTGLAVSGTEEEAYVQYSTSNTLPSGNRRYSLSMPTTIDVGRFRSPELARLSGLLSGLRKR